MTEAKLLLGLVAEDRQLKSRVIKVFVKEMTPYATGGLKDNTKEEAFNLTGSDGEVISGKTSTTNCVTAEYLDFFSNRTFPPDVVKGEQVIIVQFADTDIYYWFSAGRDDQLRRGEILRFAISDDMTVVKDLTDNNTYFIELDTKVEKRIRIKTSSSDGEAFVYNLTIDAKNSKIILGDDGQNSIELHSLIPRIFMKNRNGTTADLNASNLSLIAPQDMLLRADGSITVKTPKLSVFATLIGISSKSMTMVGEGGSGKGTLNMIGDADITGDIIVQGNINVSQDVTVGGNVSISGTVHGGYFYGGGL